MNRRGIGLIPLILTSVLAVGILALAFLSFYRDIYNKETGLKFKQIPDKKEELADKEDLIDTELENLKAVSRLIGWIKLMESDPEIVDPGLERMSLARHEIADPELVKAAAKEYGAKHDLGAEPKLKKIVEHLRAEVEKQRTAIERAYQAYHAKRVEEMATLEEQERELASLDRGIETLLSDVRTRQTRYDDKVVESRRTIADLDDQIRDKDRDRKRKLREYEGEEERTKKEIAKFQERLDEIERREELTKTALEADGEVLMSEPEKGFVFLSLGLQEGTFRGLNFDVFKLLKGGKKLWKGKVRVVEVQDDTSKAAVVSLIEPSVVIEPGDQVTNPVFEPGKVREFVYAGRFRGHLSQEECTYKVEQLGGRVRNWVTVKTDFLVVGEGYLADPNFERAKEIGVRVVRERDFYEYIGEIYY